MPTRKQQLEQLAAEGNIEAAGDLLLEFHGEQTMTKMSTGDDATLGNYLKMAAAVFGEDSKPNNRLDLTANRGQVGRGVRQGDSPVKEYDHHLSRDGVNGFVFAVRNGGQQITVSGWCYNHWQWHVGDRFLLRQKDGSTTRYRAVEVRHCFNPTDQYFMDMEFEPREKSNEKAEGLR